MRASEILMDETLPHGTADGFAAGCRGSHCPGVEKLSMSCRQASIRYASDYSYRRRIDGGLSPEAIAVEDALEQVVVPIRVDHDTRFTPVHPDPTVSVESSRMPVKLADFGDDFPEIAARVRAPKWAVRRVWVAVSPAGVLHGPFGDHAAGMAFVGEQLAPGGDSLSKPAKREWRRFTAVDEKVLREHHAAGLSDRQITKVMGRNQSVISAHRRGMGLVANGERVAMPVGVVR